MLHSTYRYFVVFNQTSNNFLRHLVGIIVYRENSVYLAHQLHFFHGACNDFVVKQKYFLKDVLKMSHSYEGS